MIDFENRVIVLTEEEEKKLYDYVKSHMRIVDSLKCILRLNKIELFQILGLWDTILEVCPDKRVKHLMRYGKNDRVKLKNYYHAIKLVGRELDGE